MNSPENPVRFSHLRYDRSPAPFDALNQFRPIAAFACPTGPRRRIGGHLTTSDKLDRTDLNKMSASDLSALLRARPGLIIGPSWCYGKGTLTELTQKFSLADPPRNDLTYFDAITTSIRQATIDHAEAERRVKTYFNRPVLQRSHKAAKLRWSAVLSLCLDGAFDNDLRQQSSGRPAASRVTSVREFGRVLPPRTVPIFRLLGDVETDDVVLTTSAYKIRVTTWPHAARAFVDLVKAAPVICLGMADCNWGLAEILAPLMASAFGAPHALVFLEEDPLLEDPLIRELTKGRTSLVSVSASASELLAIADSAEQEIQTAFSFGVTDDPVPAALAQFQDLVVLVNAQLAATVRAGERNTLHELLFSPSAARWDPFTHRLDFRRSFEAPLLDDIRSIRETLGPACAVIIRGSAATGKTTFAKRLAYELARLGDPVLWLRPWFYQDGRRVFGDAIRALAKAVPEQQKTVTVVMDDPLAFGGITPTDVASQAEAVGLRLILIAIVRSSDWSAAHDHAHFTGSLPVLSELDVPDSLDDAEWSEFPKYLTEHGIHPSEQVARTALETAPRSTKDTLSTLYWHLPQTRQRISQSIKEEYFRLGDMAGLSRVLIGAYEADSATLKKAYEIVSVADRYRTPVPVEVMVASLAIGYDEWMRSLGTGSVWGLLYADESAQFEGAAYRPRNSIVTDTIVTSLNSGRLSHAGELGILLDVLASCQGSSPVYREFCVRLLVPGEKLADITYDDGLHLYDTALTALPVSDRTLLHHKALWIKKRGKDPLGAMEVLRQALATPSYPYASRSEAEQHIYTSMAATELDALATGKVSQSTGVPEILRYLERSRSDTFFNPSAVHVEAGLIYRLLKHATVTEADTLTLVNNALARIDRTVLVLLNHPVTSLHVAKDLEYLNDVRERIVSNISTARNLELAADELWDSARRQDGFVVAARRLYKIALDSTKGTDFNAAYSYCTNAIAKIRSADAPISPAFAEAILQLYYHWRVLRVTRKESPGGPVDWSEIRELCQIVLHDTSLTRETIYRYILALAQYHLGELSSSTARFETIRKQAMPARVLHTARDYFMSSEGVPKALQGKMRRVSGAKFIYVDELKADFHVARNEMWGHDGELEQFFLRFSFAGPVAVHS